MYSQSVIRKDVVAEQEQVTNTVRKECVTAGRMARFDAMKNGIGVVIWAIVVGIILGIARAVLGTRFNVASQFHLTSDAATLTVAAVISLAIPLIVMMGVAACRRRAGQEAGGQRVEG